MSSESSKQSFFDAESSFGQSISPSGEVGVEVCELFSDENFPLPFHIRTGENSLGNPFERKRFRSVEFHGTGTNKGTMRVRIYIDGRYVCSGRVVMSESPTKHRKINLPIGNQVGYAIDVEACGLGYLRAIEYNYEQTNSAS